jgi:hypothetical protein
VSPLVEELKPGFPHMPPPMPISYHESLLSGTFDCCLPPVRRPALSYRLQASRFSVFMGQLSLVFDHRIAPLQRSQVQGRSPRACPPQAVDSGQHRPEQLLWHCNLCHLKDCQPGVTDNLGANLYELQLDAGKRPVGHLTRQREAAHEVPQVVSEQEQGKPHLVGCVADTR